jgi:hypothetical protein
LGAEAAPAVDAELYREMMTSPGGVMLRVRLHADLVQEPAAVLLRLRTADLVEDASSLLPDNVRLRTTYEWLERKFGSRNAAMALVEGAAEVLSAR